VLLDSALGTPGSQSLLGFAPRATLRGHLPEIGILQDWLEQGARDFPEGGLMGWVSYEGEFCFGAYEKIHRWRVGGGRDEPVPTAEFTLQLQPEWSEEKFVAGVERIQEYIAAGDIYQACLCYPWSGSWQGDPWALYRRWRALSPAPYAAYLHGGDRTILSASPELFLSLEGSIIRTRPIKGTRRRGGNAAEEARLRTELLSSEKERAELLMITDLERNDLGRICRTGSVQVEDLFSLETYSHVLHLVSTIRGELQPGLSHPAALAACSPGGSITGAPKLRAMEILRELERRPRGVYTGSIGWFGCNGESGFNIAIRTLEIRHGRATYGTGSGIVADSDPAAEWIETHTKATGILAACRNLQG
jgi:aminodeoxychorismate synthase component I